MVPPPRTVRVAIDVGPLHGQRTGIGHAVAGMVGALSAAGADRVSLMPYVTSTRAAREPSQRRLPIPAAAALRLWSRSSAPTDRWLGQPDVVHGTNYVVPPTRCPRVVSVYDCWFLESPRDVEANVRRAAAVLRRAVDDGAHVATSSAATSTRVRQLLGTDRVHTIHLGPPPVPTIPADDRPASLPDLGDDPFILALGTIERRKNIPTLVSAFNRLAREHETVTLVIAGAPGNDDAAVQRAVDRLDPGVARRVRLLGPVSDIEKTWLLANARTLAYPSLDEGFGFPILEAQQLGTPVVASTAGSIPEIAGSAALLSPPLDSEALAANLYWIVNSDDMHAKLARRGLANVRRFTWSATADRLIDLYQSLARSSGSSTSSPPDDLGPAESSA
jgi:glycosyltransferase involved in cell wall biosynthesis